jgi:hypothetical protein
VFARCKMVMLSCAVSWVQAAGVTSVHPDRKMARQ